MRSLVRGLLVAGGSFLFACGGDKTSGASGSASPSASAAKSAAPGASGATAEDEASPLVVVVTSPTPLVVSRLDGGVWVNDQLGKHVALALDGKDLEERPAPSGLPDDLKRVQYVGGRAPTTVWLSAATPPGDGKKVDTNPFYMLQNKANAWKPITEDWQPLVVPWSKRRVLAMSTSSGKLKIKTLVPYAKTPLPDQPSMKVPDAECAKSLKLAEAVTVTDDFVLGVGRCKLGDTKQPTYVMVRWIQTDAAPEKPAPSPEPSADTAPSSPSPDADSDVGVPMKVVALTTDRSQHRAIAVVGTSAFIASGTESGDARVFETTKESETPTPVELPKFEGPLLDLAATPNGDLYLVTKTTLFQRKGGAWTPLPAPKGVELEHAEAAGATLWVSGKRDGGDGLLMRFGEGSATLKW